MKSKHQRLIRFYMNITVKKPIMVLLVISLGLTSVLGLILTLNADVLTAHTGITSVLSKLFHRGGL